MTEAVSLGELLHEEALFGLTGVRKVGVPRGRLFPSGSTYGVEIDGDFLELALQASKHLQECGRSNVLCGLARAIGTLRLDGSDSRLPAKRMPVTVKTVVCCAHQTSSTP